MRSVTTFILLWFVLSFSHEKKIAQVMDFDGDHIPDSALLSISYQDTLHPFTWRLTIKAIRNIIFDYTEIDSAQNEIFSDTSLFDNCKDYNSCKLEYYFSYMPKNIIRKSDYNRDGLPLYKIFESTITRDTPRYLRDSLKLDEKKVNEVIQDLLKRNQEKNLPTVWLMYSPVAENFPVAFSRVLNKFVPVLEW